MQGALNTNTTIATGEETLSTNSSIKDTQSNYQIRKEALNKSIAEAMAQKDTTIKGKLTHYSENKYFKFYLSNYDFINEDGKSFLEREIAIHERKKRNALEEYPNIKYLDFNMHSFHLKYKLINDEENIEFDIDDFVNNHRNLEIECFMNGRKKLTEYIQTNNDFHIAAKQIFTDWKKENK